MIAHGAGADDSFQHMNEAEAFVKSFKSQLRDLGTSFRILKPLDSADADEAIKALRRHPIKHGIRRQRLRDIVDEWIDRWNEQNRSVSLRHLLLQRTTSIPRKLTSG